MNVIDQKVLKGKLDTMNEMKLFRDWLGSFGSDLAYPSREVFQLGKKLFSFISVFVLFYYLPTYYLIF